MLSCYRLWIDRYLHHTSTTKLKDLYQISNASRIGLGNSNQQIHEASSVRLNSPQKSLKSIDVFQEKNDGPFIFIHWRIHRLRGPSRCIPPLFGSLRKLRVFLQSSHVRCHCKAITRVAMDVRPWKAWKDWPSNHGLKRQVLGGADTHITGFWW